MPNLLTTKDRRHETRLKMVLSWAAQLTRMGETCVMLHERLLVRPEVRGEGWLWQEREGTRVLACTDRVKLPDLQADSDPTATCLHVGTFDPFKTPRWYSITTRRRRESAAASVLLTMVTFGQPSSGRTLFFDYPSHNVPVGANLFHGPGIGE